MRGRASGFGARISSMVSLLILDFVWGHLIEQFAVVLSDLRLDKSDLGLGQPIALVELSVCPLPVQRQIRYEGVHVTRCVLCRLAKRDRESNKSSAQILLVVGR